MAAQAETGIVVAAFVVGLPEIQQGAGERFAGAGLSTKPTSSIGCPAMPVFEQFDSLRRRRLEVRPFGLRQCCFVAVVARGRGGKRGLSDAAIDHEQRTGREDSRSKYNAPRRGVDHGALPSCRHRHHGGRRRLKLCPRPSQIRFVAGARQPIVSSSSIMPEITDSPPSQNLGSLASSPNGFSSSE